ncbi:MAG TPA: MmcB family DNA repair protein [Euzebya sp.]|nr:MmcB family DNA repair protein [Euzebya sp.]
MSEVDIRRAVVGMLAAGPAGIARLIVHEYGIAAGRVRADVAELTGDAIHLVEIKSAADTLSRLPRQADLYCRVADRCTLAADPAHLDAAAALLPDWWGLVAVDGDRLRMLRAGRPNPAPDPVTTAMLLWAPELATAVREAGQTGGTAGVGRDGLAAVLVAAAADVRPVVRAGLLARRWEDVAAADGGTRFVRHPDPVAKRPVRRASSRARRRIGG